MNMFRGENRKKKGALKFCRPLYTVLFSQLSIVFIRVTVKMFSNNHHLSLNNLTGSYSYPVVFSRMCPIISIERVVITST